MKRFWNFVRTFFPFGLLWGPKPRHFREMLKVAWENKNALGWAWKVLRHGVCDGCSLGPKGLRDDVITGTHLCLTRLKLLRLNTMPALPDAAWTDIGRLRLDGRLVSGDRLVTIEQVSVPRRGQRFAFIMDTRLCDAAFALAEDADMLVCESTFAENEAALARDYGHLTAGQAGRIAAESGARLLVLTHFSQRYERGDEHRPQLGDALEAAVVVIGLGGQHCAGGADPPGRVVPEGHDGRGRRPALGFAVVDPEPEPSGRPLEAPVPHDLAHR